MASDDTAAAVKKYKHGKQDFELGGLLGDGAFAKVVEGKVINEDSPLYDRMFAIKIMDKRHIVKNDKIKYVNIEKEVFLATKAHPFLCHMHFSFQDPYSLYMVLDFCDEGELSYLIYKYMKLSQDLTKFYMSEVISAVEYMHSLGIYHRDLKPENVLIHADGHIRLTDFGTCKQIQLDDEKQVEEAKAQQAAQQQPSEPKSSEPDLENSPAPTRQQRGSFVGTAMYVPPELLGTDEFSFAGMDFWALGAVIYQCLTGDTPFSAPSEYLIFKKIEIGEYDKPDYISPEALDIIEKLLDSNFKTRLGMKGFSEIRSHPFFKDCLWDWDEMKNHKPPQLPSTPKDSPANLPEGRDGRSGSKWDEIGDSQRATSIPTTPKDKDAIDEDAEIDDNSELFDKWKKLLNAEERIRFGSQVEMSKTHMFGKKTAYVMLYTSESRVLLIDHSAMKVKYDIPKSSVVEVTPLDKHKFTIRTPKKTYKFKATGASSQQWKAKLETTF